GRLRESFVFEVRIADRSVTLLLRDGFVTEEFIDLAQKDDRTDEDESRLDELKAQLAQRVMAADAADVYDIALGAETAYWQRNIEYGPAEIQFRRN
ncbi:MAG TPA: hypothetical protein VF874_17110, partial [Mycobacterium sp.]